MYTNDDDGPTTTRSERRNQLFFFFSFFHFFVILTKVVARARTYTRLRENRFSNTLYCDGVRRGVASNVSEERRSGGIARGPPRN